MFKKFNFWSRFSRFFLILAVFAVLALTGNVLQRGPVPTLADNEDYNIVGPATPGYQDGQVPLDEVAEVQGPANPAYQDGQTPLEPEPAPVYQPQPQPAACVPTWRQLNPECDWNSKQVYEVQQNSCTGEYRRYNYHFQEGACGYSSARSVAPVAPAPVSLPVTGPQTMTVCNGQVKTWDQLQSELRVAGYPGPWDQGSALAAYNRAACPVHQPAPVVQPQPQPAPVCPAVGSPSALTPSSSVQAGTQTLTWTSAANATHYRLRIDDMTANGWTGNCNSVNAGDVCLDHVGGTSYTYTFQAGRQYHWWVEAVNSCSVSTSVEVYLNVPAAPRPVQPAPVLVPAPVQVAQAPAAQAQCPAGTNMTISDSTIVCVSQQQTQQSVNNNVNNNTVTVNNPQPQVVQAAQPQVVYAAATEVKQLPKTGLPLAAWFISGLLPVGLKLKRFGQDQEGSVNAGLQIWQNREMLRSFSA